MAKIIGCGGIYEIRCENNDRRYIGKSRNFGRRWGAHLFFLHTGRHANKKLQKDFNKYGASAFRFSILELCSDEEDMSCLEKRIISECDRSMLYNSIVFGKWNSGAVRVEKFIEYINSVWLTKPEDVDKCPHKRIWRDEDKYEIRKRFWDCRIVRLPFDSITFVGILKIMERDLGYTVMSSRHRVEGQQVTCKMITSFDSQKVSVPDDVDSSGECDHDCSKQTA